MGQRAKQAWPGQGQRSADNGLRSPQPTDNKQHKPKQGNKSYQHEDKKTISSTYRHSVLSCNRDNVIGKEKAEMTSYLFAYFTGNAPEQEQICFAISDDGFNYTPLNGGRPIISSDTIALSKGVRDPHILRADDGTFYMVATDMRCSLGWTSNRGIVLMKSNDLIHWEHHTVHFPERFKGTEFANVTRVWAPQTIYDKSAGKYMVYFSLLTDDKSIPYDKVYYCYATPDFSGLEGTPKVLFDYKEATIDTDIVEDENGTYHLFSKPRRPASTRAYANTPSPTCTLPTPGSCARGSAR